MVIPESSLGGGSKLIDRLQVWQEAMQPEGLKDSGARVRYSCARARWLCDLGQHVTFPPVPLCQLMTFGLAGFVMVGAHRQLNEL